MAFVVRAAVLYGGIWFFMKLLSYPVSGEHYGNYYRDLYHADIPGLVSLGLLAVIGVCASGPRRPVAT